MPYYVYSENVTTAPEDLWNSSEGGPSPRAVRLSCTTQNCNINFAGAAPGMDTYPLILTADADPIEVVFSQGQMQAFSAITAWSSTGTAVVTMETTAF